LNIEEAIKLSLPLENPDHYHILGRVLVAQCKYEEARQYLLKASKLHEQAHDHVGQWDDVHYICIVNYYLCPDFLLARELTDCELYYESVGDDMRNADVMATQGMVHIRTSCFDDAEVCLQDALAIHTEIGSVLGQAFDLHHLGCLHIQECQYDLAEEKLRHALLLHTQVENVQGQADDFNKLCEVQLRRQQYNEALTGICHALALHIQIDDIPGQGDDLYIQACVFLEQLRLDEAEDTVRKAIELHSQSEGMYSEARDFATLSSILWQKQKGSKASGDPAQALEALDKAIHLFDKNNIKGELAQCNCKRQEIVEDALHTTATCDFGITHV
jgi:tetratricopeptide (TPR) repeat protein